MKLFHGSKECNLEYKSYDACNIYSGALFFSDSENAAKSHGQYLYSIDIDDNSILKHDELVAMQYSDDIDIFGILNSIALDIELNIDTDEKLERLAELVIDNVGIYTWSDTDIDLLNADDITYAGWRAQSIRFILAQELGYSAVEVRDEHGISYMVSNPSLVKEF